MTYRLTPESAKRLKDLLNTFDVGYVPDQIRTATQKRIEIIQIGAAAGAYRDGQILQCDGASFTSLGSTVKVLCPIGTLTAGQVVLGIRAGDHSGNPVFAAVTGTSSSTSGSGTGTGSGSSPAAFDGGKAIGSMLVGASNSSPWGYSDTVYDTSSYFNLIADSTKCTIPRTGIYSFGAWAGWTLSASETSGVDFSIDLTLNGSNFSEGAGDSRRACLIGSFPITEQSFAMQATFNTGDVLKVIPFRTAITHTEEVMALSFWIQYLGHT